MDYLNASNDELAKSRELCFVIPDLIRNPVLSMVSWMPAFAGMTVFGFFTRPSVTTNRKKGNTHLYG